MSTSNTGARALSLGELCRMIQSTVASNMALQNVWVVGETSDLRMSGGHCYLELLEKDARGGIVARVRANIWASLWPRLSEYFRQQTGSPLASGMKVLVRVSASYHPAYGVSLTVSSIDPGYTMGDAVRRRNEILARLKAEGLLDLNRTVEWPRPALKVAVVSAAGAAGYGDFINQLYGNQRHIHFEVKLFPAVLQGERTSPSVIAALEAIASDPEGWDCVVLIRGGGATSDLAAFDDYDLACHIANFPMPVIVGIGHERDITVLDYVANMRVKTPTAAAEWLIGRATAELDMLERMAGDIYRCVSERISGNRQQLSYLSAYIPGLVNSVLSRQKAALDRASISVASSGPRMIMPARVHVDNLAAMLSKGIQTRLESARNTLDARAGLIEALSPQRVLARGFSLTRTVDGRTVTDAESLSAGDEIVTLLSRGSVRSRVTPNDK